MNSWDGEHVPDGWTVENEAAYLEEMQKYQRAFFHGPRLPGGEPVYAAVLPPTRGETWEAKRRAFHTENAVAKIRMAAVR